MMTVSPAELVSSLAAEVRRDWPDIEVELTVFPSGAADLGVRAAGRYFTIMYTTIHQMYGVDELTADEDAGFNTGYRYCFREFLPAAEQFRSLLAGVPQRGGPVSEQFVPKNQTENHL